MNAQEQANNAIRWIDTLPSYKQAPKGSRGRLGNELIGFCCFGAGCIELGIDYLSTNSYSEDFQFAVGLIHLEGFFAKGVTYCNEHSLSGVNDSTEEGFENISKLMKNHPEWMFNPEAAKAIKRHYS